MTKLLNVMFRGGVQVISSLNAVIKDFAAPIAWREFQIGSRRLTKDEVCRALGNHDRRSIDIAADQIGENRSVNDS
jgi:hypothetical protein